MDVEAILREYTGEQRITMAQLAEKAGLSGRDTRRIVNELRSFGKPIGFDNNGVFWATRPEELDHAVKDLAARATTLRGVVAGLKTAQENLSNVQVRLL